MALGKSTGADALRRTALEEPATFVRVAASLLPEEMKLQSSTESLSDEELDRRLAQTANPGGRATERHLPLARCARGRSKTPERR
jgi:hypothetical protein